MKSYLQNRRAFDIVAESNEPTPIDLTDLIVDAPKRAPAIDTVSDSGIDITESQPTSLDGYLALVQNSLHQFLLNPGFDNDIHLIFGTNVDLARARQLILDFATQYSSSLPEIKICSGFNINSAQGAYAAASDTVYLASEFLRDNATNTDVIHAVLLEEFGHALDARLNVSDAPGDEGELFSALVRGVALTEIDVQRIQAEDDTIAVIMDNQNTVLELSSTSLGIRQGYGFRNDSINYYDPTDYWQFSTLLTGGVDDYIRISSNSTLVDLVLRLYDSYGNIITESDVAINSESVSLEDLPAGTYTAQVFDYNSAYYLGYYNTYASYTLEINAPEIPRDRFESNETLTSATPVDSGFLLPDGQRYFSNLTIGLSGTTVDADVFKFTTTRVATDADYILSFINGSGDIDLTLVDESNSPIYTTYWTASGAGWNQIPLAGLQPGTYYLLAGSFEGILTPSYDLVFALPQSLTADVFDTSASNNTFDTATNLGKVSGFWQKSDLSIHQSSDVDWLKFELSGQGTSQNYIGIDFDGSLSDLDIALYNAANQLIDDSSGVGDTEVISLSGLSAGTYYLKVNGYDGSTCQYNLTINVPGTNTSIANDFFESPTRNDSRINATDLTAPTTGLKGAGFHAWENLSISSADQDWFKLKLENTGVLGNYVAAVFDTSIGDLDLEIYRESETTPFLQSAGVRDVEKLDLNGLPVGTYYVHVLGYSGATNPNYVLAVNTPGSDRYEDNDTQDKARTLTRSTAQQTWTDLSVDDPDWFKINLPSNGTNNDFVRIDLTNSLGDLDLEIYDANQQRIDYSAGVVNSEQISLDGLETGDYFVKIFGYREAKNPN